MTAAAPHLASRRRLAWGFALIVGLAATWLLHRHQFASRFDLFPGPRGDSRLIAYLCEHWYQTLRGKAELLSPAMFYPVKGILGYSETLLLFALPYSLLRFLGVGIFTALALVVVLFTLLNFLAGFALLFHGLRLSWLASATGALFFAFNNPKLSLPDNLQLQAVWPLAVMGLCLILFFTEVHSLSGKRAFWLLAAAGSTLALQLLTAFYLGWFAILWCGLLFLLTALSRQARQLYITSLRLHRRPLLGAIAVAAPILLAFAIVYVPVLHAVGGWPYSADLMHIPQIHSYLLMADGNFIWSDVTATLLRAAGNGPDWGRRLGIGAVATLTWLGLTISAVTMRARRPFLTSAILAVDLLVLLALQVHGHSLWRLVYEVTPGGKAIRDVGRFMIVVALPIAIGFAFVVDAAQRRIARRRGLQAVLVGLIAFGVFEQFNRGDEQFFSIRAENQHLQRMAARLPNDCQAFYLTARRFADQPIESSQSRQWMHDAMLVSVLRGTPTLNGRSGKVPPGWDLRDITAPEYDVRVRNWIDRHRLNGRICELEVDQ